MEINKEKHPKVFKKVDGYLGRDEIRDLYDFFDENGILVLITHESDLDWKFIIQINCNEVDFGVWYATRQDAEKGGFEKAVEIMETMLENS